MEIVYRAFKQPNAVATITGLISNVGHRVNCGPEKYGLCIGSQR
jgi:hypothetical protein